MFAFALFAAMPAQIETFFWSIPGAGSVEPNLNRVIMPSVNSSFLRRSGVRNARMNAVSMRDPSSSVKPAFQRLPYPTRRPPGELARQGVPERASLGRGGPQFNLAEQSDCSARRLDLLLGRLGDRVGADPQRHGQFALAEHLDQFATADGAARSQALRRHFAARRVQLL